MDTENNIKDLLLKILDKYLGGIKEYVGILTLLITTGATILSSLLKFGYYVYRYGAALYWNLPIETIDIYSKNTFFNIVIYLVLALFVCVVNRCFYMIFHKIYKKSKCWFWSILIAYILLLLLSIFVVSLSRKVATAMVLVFAILLVFVFPAYILCVVDNFFVNKASTKKKKKKIKAESDEKQYTLKEQIWQCVAIITITASLEMGLLFGAGCLSAKSTADFRVVEINNDTCAIIYETNDAYYISPCEIENGKIINIDKNSKELIEKENITYTHYQYSK